jgi:hypothetical protein
VWLRLVRNAGTTNTLSAYYRTDTTATWTQVGSAATPLGLSSSINPQVGLFTVSVDTAGKTPHPTTAVFDDFRGSGEIANPNLDLSFNGTGTNSDMDVVMASDFSAGSVDFTGYTGSYSFNTYTLSVARTLRFNSTMPIVAGTGKIVLSGATGPDTLATRTNVTLPAIRKTGAGKLVLAGGILNTPSLSLEAGTLDFNDNGANLTALTASGAAIQGLGIDDSLVINGDADFSGFSNVNLPNGMIVIKSMGNGVTTHFNPAGMLLPRVYLSTWATGSGGVTLATGPGALIAANGLVLRNHGGAAGLDATLDFNTASPAVTVGGDLLTLQDGAGSGKHILRLGKGTWSVDGNVTLSMGNVGNADSSLFRFTKASGTQTVSVSNGSLFAIEHAAAGTLRLGAALSANGFRNSAGSFDFNGYDLTLKGDLTVVNGVSNTFLNLGGRTLKAGGNASFSGKSASEILELNPLTAWKIQATGTLTADSAAIANSDATGGSAGAADKSCVDGKGNKNWAFWTAPQAPTITREPVDAIAKPGWKVSFSLQASGSGALSYEWRKAGDTLVLSNDTLLLLDSVKETQDNSLYYCVVSNALGKDTSAQARLTVRACDSSFVPPQNLTVQEGGKVVLAGKTGCASEVLWTPVSGPVPRLLDPSVDTLTFTAPRVQGDSSLVLQYGARFGARWETKDVAVTVKDTIPDPQVSLPTPAPWDGTGKKVIRPVIANAPALAKFTGYPVRYLWSVAPLIVDTALKGDSITVTHPVEDGDMEITLCADNGGAASCAKAVLHVQRLTVSILLGRAHAGPVWISSGRLTWNAPGIVRIVDWRGRVLWQASGHAGQSAAMPAEAERSLRAHSARLDFMTVKAFR